MSKLQIYIIIGLIAAILIVFVIKAVQKSAETKAAAAAAQNQTTLALAAINYKQNQNALDAQEQASVGDWLNTVGSIGDSVAAIFSGINLGLGGGGKTSDVAGALAKG